MKIFTYVLVMLLQVFVPCYYGNEFFRASEKISTSLFHSKWINCSKEYKEAMIIFAENSKKPLKITAISSVDIDFRLFSRILNSAYSLFALFNNISM